MTYRRISAAVAFVTAFAVCRVLHANSLSPYVWFFPGMAAVSVIYAFPASVLAAVCERPFLSAAGIERRPLVHSLRANFLSTLVGIMLIPIAFPAIYAIGLFWCLAAVCVSCVVEIGYLRRFALRSVRWRWIVLGNALSSLVLMVVPPLTQLAKQLDPTLVWTLYPYVGSLTVGALVVSLAVFLASFLWPTARRQQQDQQRDEAQEKPMSGQEDLNEPVLS